MKMDQMLVATDSISTLRKQQAIGNKKIANRLDAHHNGAWTRLSANGIAGLDESIVCD
jgi:hypothetical protein